MPLEGLQLGRYQLVRLIGNGGMGEVYLADDTRIQRQVAVKIIRSETVLGSDAELMKQSIRLFQREMKAVTTLDHPYILPLIDFGEEEINNYTYTYMIMPYRQEGSLIDWLKRQNSNGILLPEEVTHLVQQAAQAIQHAHDHQIIHQDIKPSNFLIRSKEEPEEYPDILLADFGVAKFTTATATSSQSIRGTPAYMAPEQWSGEAVPATDQYALAIMAYQFLVGGLPFQGTPMRIMHQHIHTQPISVSQRNPNLSKELDEVLLHALQKNPEDRFASVSAFARAFQLAQTKQGEGQSPGSTDPRTLAIPVEEPEGTTRNAIQMKEELGDTIAAENTVGKQADQIEADAKGGENEELLEPTKTGYRTSPTRPLASVYPTLPSQGAETTRELQDPYPPMATIAVGKKAKHRTYSKRTLLQVAGLILLLLASVFSLVYATSTPRKALGATRQATPKKQAVQTKVAGVQITSTPVKPTPTQRPKQDPIVIKVVPTSAPIVQPTTAPPPPVQPTTPPVQPTAPPAPTQPPPPTPAPTQPPPPPPTPTQPPPVAVSGISILGNATNWNGYCQSIGDTGASFDGQTAYDWHCVTPAGQHVAFSVAAMCDWQYGVSQAVDRMIDYNSSNGWQCMIGGQKLGMATNWNGYCQSIGDTGAALDGQTAYDWHCVTSAGQHVVFSVGDMCSWQYRLSGSLDRLTNYSDPNAWECWG